VADDDVRAGEALARAWLQGKSELIDDLAALVDGMDKPLDATARAFIVTIGNSARLAPKGKARPTLAGAPAPARLDATPPTEVPPLPPIDVDEFRRRRRERELAARLDELGRRNAEAWQQRPVDTFWRS